MFYALVRSYNDCGDGCHRLFFGTLSSIARDLMDQCSTSVLWEDIGGLSIEEAEEEFCCDLSLHRLIAEGREPDEKDIRLFNFSYSGEDTNVLALVDSYPALVEAFNAYAQDRFCGEYRMTPGNITDPAVLEKVDDALVSLGELNSPYFIEVFEEE